MDPRKQAPLRRIDSNGTTRVHDGYDADGNTVYADVRGPDGQRYLAHRWGLADRMKERFGVGESADARRRLRNARKNERKAGRK